MAVAVGIHAFLTMPRTEDPSITIRQGLVLAAYPGATSEQVETTGHAKARRAHLQVPGSAQAEDLLHQPAGTGDHQRGAGGQRQGRRPVLGQAAPRDERDQRDGTAQRRHRAAWSTPISATRWPCCSRSTAGATAIANCTITRTAFKDELRTVRNVGKLATYGEQSEEIRITSSLDRMSQYFADPLARHSGACSSATSSRAPAAWKPGRTRCPCAPPDCSPPRTRSAACWWTFRAPASRSISAISPMSSGAIRIRSFVVRYDGEPSVLLSDRDAEGQEHRAVGR